MNIIYSDVFDSSFYYLLLNINCYLMNAHTSCMQIIPECLYCNLQQIIFDRCIGIDLKFLTLINLNM